MINLLISGANGRMGKKVFESASHCDDVLAVCGVDIKCDCNASFPIYDTFSKVKENVDVVIDFSSPATSIPTSKFSEALFSVILNLLIQESYYLTV